MPDALQITNLSVGPVVHDVSFHLPAGRLTALVGASGSGKSLTLTALLGISPLPVRADTYTITVDDHVYDPLKNGFSGVQGSLVAWVPQDAVGALDPLRTVGVQVRRSARGTDPRPWLERAGLADPDRVAALYPHQCSGGMAQRVVLAQALARGARFLLADEPTTALDPLMARSALDTLVALARDGHGVLLVTHDLRALPHVADRIVLMADGTVAEVVESGNPGDLTSEAGVALLAPTRQVAAGVLG